MDLSAARRQAVDLSQIASQQRTHNPYGHDIDELTPYERNYVISLWADIEQKYAGMTMTPTATRQMENEIVQRFANEVGLVVTVDWEEHSPEPLDRRSDTVVFFPTVAIEARTAKANLDREKIAREVQSGELDGKVGTVRRDGTWTESPSSQIVT